MPPRHRRRSLIVATLALLAAPLAAHAQARNFVSATTVALFGGLGGAGWQQGVAADSEGNLYTALSIGTTGAVIEIPHGKVPATPVVLHSFSGSDGQAPAGTPVIDAEGNLYGVTSLGGAYGYGTVYRLAAGSRALTTLHSFSNRADGGLPRAGVVLDANGKLYGTTSAGAMGFGTVFMLTPPPASQPAAAWAATTLHAFAGATDGGFPGAPVLRDSLGNLFGTTTGGGAATPGGTVFKLTRTGPGFTYKVLHVFAAGANDGAQPQGGLAMNANGTLYGTTNAGGSGGRGSVFALSPAASGTLWSETVLYRFTGGKDGAQPVGGVALGATGALYGTTEHGGANAAGVVFKLTPTGSGWTEAALFAFPALSSNAAPGNLPTAGLLRTASGLAYGTTSFGGGGWHTGGLFSIAAP